jgi:membrane-bound serine protease (ClpP class)
VAIYVGPSGARAASAGTFILVSAHVAAMAPGTTTGAAHPVNLGGGDVDETMAEKVLNDAASFMRSLAEKRGRNAEWAESAVRESESITADEALDLDVIDIVAVDVRDLLSQMDGMNVETLSGIRTLRTRNARVEDVVMGWRDRLLSMIANPNIAYLLLMLGTMQVLPVNSVGLLLLLLGIIMLILELNVTSYGLLTIGGVVSLTLGAILLFEAAAPIYRVSWSVLVPTVIVTTLFFLFVLGKGLAAQRSAPVTGREGIVGEVGLADSRIAPEGRVYVHGEYWNARSEKPVEQGDSIEVVAVEGRTLVVRPRTS